jgi:hypothetical protein
MILEFIKVLRDKVSDAFSVSPPPWLNPAKERLLERNVHERETVNRDIFEEVPFNRYYESLDRQDEREDQGFLPVRAYEKI